MNEEVMTDSITYRVIILCSKTGKMLVVKNGTAYSLPQVHISLNVRIAVQVIDLLREQWKITCVVIDSGSASNDDIAMVEVLAVSQDTQLHPICLRELPAAELDDVRRADIETLLNGSSLTGSPFSRLGWINDAIKWIERATQRRISSMSGIRQIHASGRFLLLEAPLEGGCSVWLKATGPPNAHERAVTRLLASLPALDDNSIGYVPAVIDERPAWNAWLSAGGARSFTDVPAIQTEETSLLDHAVTALAQLQIAAATSIAALRGSGAFDQSWEAWRRESSEVFDLLQDAMAQQTSNKAPRLSRTRLQQLHNAFGEICDRAERLSIPATILHGDLNPGNLVFLHGYCQFVDWSEAYLGFAPISVKHLLLLLDVSIQGQTAATHASLSNRYLEEWCTEGGYSAADMAEALRYASFLAPFSALYGRGEWFHTSERNLPRRQLIARTLARYMDRAEHEICLSRPI
jgi:hypothetical protein